MSDTSEGEPANENIPSQLHSKLVARYQVFNLDIPGWGIDQMYFAYKRYRDAIKPRIVVLTFIDDDVSRVLEAYRVAEGLTKPSFSVENGALVIRHSVSAKEIFLNEITGKSVLRSISVRQIYLMNNAKAVVERIFREMAEEAQQRNERFVVLRIPTRKSLDRERLVLVPADYSKLLNLPMQPIWTQPK